MQTSALRWACSRSFNHGNGFSKRGKYVDAKGRNKKRQFRFSGNIGAFVGDEYLHWGDTTAKRFGSKKTATGNGEKAIYIGFFAV